MSVHSLPLDPERAALLAARSLVGERREALAEAARLIAGRREAARVLALAAALGRAPRLMRPLRAEIERLAALLALELDPGHGAGLHPADPRVPEICLLADAVARLIEEIAPPEPAAPAVRAVPTVAPVPRRTSLPARRAAR